MKKTKKMIAYAAVTVAALIGVIVFSDAADAGTVYTTPCVEVNHHVSVNTFNGTLTGSDFTMCRVIPVAPTYLGEVRFQALNGVYSPVYRPIPG